MKMRLRLALAGVLLVSSISAFAQTAQVGQISGQVHDESGAVMPGVAVTLVSEQRGFMRDTVTDEQGKSYFYEPLGSNRLPGFTNALDTSVEATFRPYRTSQIGLKAEVFNVLNNEEKDHVGSTVWYESTATAACNTARENFGKATARGRFRTPRTFRFTAIFRF
jgi:hypothetical protein